MAMNRIITRHELWNLSSEQINKMTKGRLARIFLTNGNVKDVRIKNSLLSANPPHLFVGVLITDSHSINLQDINYVELK